jgi:curved DNA-binding protein
VEYKDYYKVLGVERSAKADEIKKAYRKLVRQYHPDVSKHKDADAKTKEINEAYDVLGDAEKRAAYDELGRGYRPGQEFRPPPDWGSQHGFGGAGEGADPGDIFADLFAHMGRRGRTGRGMGGGTFRMAGEDIRATIAIDLRDLYQGATRTIGVRDKTLSVTIPKGMTPGQQLRMKGQGRDGMGGGPAGDLYLEVQLNPDPHYRVEGTDVYENVPVTPWEAALGAGISVPTPAGPVEVTVPAGSQNGRKLRLKGRGIPAAQPGDLYLVLEVVLPPASSERARELYQEMARDLAFNPRERIGA